VHFKTNLSNMRTFIVSLKVVCLRLVVGYRMKFLGQGLCLCTCMWSIFVEVRVGYTWEGSEDFMQCVIVCC
jgi:hypothetical protein